MNKKIYVGGMHSGQSPSPGLGIARSIKHAFSDLTVVGVSHWQGSSGCHDPAVDKALVLPIWSQIDDKLLTKDIRSVLSKGDVWLPALDLEIHWASENLDSHPLLLSPSRRALLSTEKPGVKAVESLGMKVPTYISANESDSEIHSFLRQHSWQCWMKSVYHDARRITSWPAFEKVRDSQIKNWKTDKIYLQRHIVGREETIAFAAHEGDLLGAVHVDKCLLTSEGKTWAGKVSEPEPEVMETLAEVLKSLNWSGGGEIEYVRDPDGGKWVIEWNPRFPAWIYGSAIAGVNLPARLIGRALGIEFHEKKNAYPYFTRVVYEIPAKEEVGMPLLPDAIQSPWVGDGKKGGGASAAPLPTLRHTLKDEEAEIFANHKPETVEPLFLDEIERAVKGFDGPSPARVPLEAWTKMRFDKVEGLVRGAAQRSPSIRIGYSVKTSPTIDNLFEAYRRGFLAECISQSEIHAALKAGFKAEQIILNGPGKFWPTTERPVEGLHMIFCDSVEEFERVAKMKNIASCIGFRIRLPHLSSRFGNSLDELAEFKRINDALRAYKGRAHLGFHFHMPSWAIGVQRWLDSLDALLLWCRSIQQVTGREVRYLDLGGGFYPGDLEEMNLAAIQKSVRAALPSVEEIYFELGRSLTQQGDALISRVLDVRRSAKSKKLLEVVVDASIAELPLARVYPHRIFFHSKSSSNRCQILRKGPSRILGRICMEDDILCNQIEIPETVSIGDLIVFGDAGAYERSMSYEFGRG